MARDSEYETLYSQYQILLSQNKDLTEQLSTKSSQWDAYATNSKTTEDHARALCEMILAKDPAEMTLGTAKTWGSFTTDELIQKAKNAFVKYNKERTQLMRNIMDVAEERRMQIESLTEQLQMYITQGKIPQNITPEQIYAEAEQKRLEESAKEKSDNALKKAVQEGRVDVMVVEDARDVDEEEIAANQKLMDQAEQGKLTASSVKTVNSSEKQQRLSEAKEEVEKVHLINLQDTIDSMTSNHWTVLEIISKYGLSVMKDVIDKMVADNPSLSVSTARNAIIQLTHKEILKRDQIALPLRGNTIIVSLTDKGIRICKGKFGKELATPEWKLICGEHDNLEHGYGIVDIQKQLESTGKFTEVSCFNRNKPIDVKVEGQAYKFIPDLVCTGKRDNGDKFKAFMEYERGTHTQNDFSLKCSKMCCASNFLYFVTPNIHVLRKVQSQVIAWAESRGIANLKTIVARITTAAYLRDHPDDMWVLEYRFGKGIEPTKDRSGAAK